MITGIQLKGYHVSGVVHDFYMTLECPCANIGIFQMDYEGQIQRDFIKAHEVGSCDRSECVILFGPTAIDLCAYSAITVIALEAINV